MKKKINKNPLTEIIEDEYKLLEEAKKYGDDALIDAIHFFIDIDHQARRTSTFAAFNGGLRLLIYKEGSKYYRTKDWAAHARMVFPELSDKKRQNWMKLASSIREYLFPTIFSISQRNLLKLIRLCDEPRIDDFLAKHNISTDFDIEDTTSSKKLSQDVCNLLRLLEKKEQTSTEPQKSSLQSEKPHGLAWSDIPSIDPMSIDPLNPPNSEDYIEPLENEGFMKTVELLNWLETNLPADGYYSSHYLMDACWELFKFQKTLIERFNAVHRKRNQFILRKAKNPLIATL